MRLFLDLPSWEAERSVLATSLNSDAWRTVSHTVDGMIKGRLAIELLSAEKPLHPDWLPIMSKQASELNRAADLFSKPIL
jgi:hypothetical protein